MQVKYNRLHLNDLTWSSVEPTVSVVTARYQSAREKEWRMGGGGLLRGGRERARPRVAEWKMADTCSVPKAQ